MPRVTDCKGFQPTLCLEGSTIVTGGIASGKNALIKKNSSNYNNMKTIITILLILASISAFADNADTIYVNDIVSYAVEEAASGSELIWKVSGAEIKNQSGNQISLSYPEAGEYSVMVCEKNDANCLGDFAQIDIVVIKRDEPSPNPPSEIALEFPNIFTPNGDGVNDFYHINYNICPSDFQIHIFSRSGRKVFSSTDPNFKWDGHDCSPDTYFYTAQFSHNGVVFSEKGTINLVRGK